MAIISVEKFSPGGKFFTSEGDIYSSHRTKNLHNISLEYFPALNSSSILHKNVMTYVPVDMSLYNFLHRMYIP